MKFFFIKKSKGFTLVELLIICTIIGIMASIVLSYLNAAKLKGRDGKRIADINNIQRGLEVYFSSCSFYPVTLNGLTSDCNGNQILNGIPTDPLNVSPYQYKYFATDPSAPTPLQYHVCATLEITYAGGIGKSGQPPIPGGVDPCNGASGVIYDKYGP